MGAGAASLLMNSSRRAARHFDEFHNPYRGDHPASYVPGGVAGYGYPVEERAPAPGMRERAEQLSDRRACLGQGREHRRPGLEAAEAGRARVVEAASEVRREAGIMARQHGANSPSTAAAMACCSGRSACRWRRSPSGRSGRGGAEIRTGTRSAQKRCRAQEQQWQLCHQRGRVHRQIARFRSN